MKQAKENINCKSKRNSIAAVAVSTFFPHSGPIVSFEFLILKVIASSPCSTLPDRCIFQPSAKTDNGLQTNRDEKQGFDVGEKNLALIAAHR